MYSLYYFISFLVTVLLCFYFGTVGMLLPLLLCLLVLLIYAGQCNKTEKRILIIAFWWYTIVGTINYCSYLYYCGFTFAPYSDDSYYWNNIMAIVDKDAPPRFTLYEVFMALLCIPFKNAFSIQHYELLPVNWLMGALVVNYAVRFANMIKPIQSRKQMYISVWIILLNTSFIDGVVHLYRDIFMCLLFIIAMVCIYKNQYLKGIAYAFIIGFIRGANAFILLSYIIISRLSSSFRKSRKKFLVLIMFLSCLFWVSARYIPYENYMRSFSTESQGTVDSFEDRVEKFRNREGASGGVVQLLRSNNPLYKAIAVPIYMMSPFKARKLFIVEDYSMRDVVYPSVFRLRIETIWEIIMIAFYSFIIPGLFIGFYFWFKDIDMRNMTLFLCFLLMVVSVTYISMQTRHKMMFILLYPLAYNYYCICSSHKVKQIAKYCGVGLFFLLCLYNIV